MLSSTSLTAFSVPARTPGAQNVRVLDPVHGTGGQTPQSSPPVSVSPEKGTPQPGHGLPRGSVLDLSV